MAVEVLSIDPEAPERGVVERFAEEVLRGGCVGFPTDTFYGLGCSLLDPAAIEMLHRIKRRPPEMALISLIADRSSVEALAVNVSESARELMRRYWPGPLSLIFQAAAVIPERSRGPNDTVALRFPNHRLSLALVQAIGGPLVATSANLSGQPPARAAAEVAEIFGNQLDLVLDGGPATATRPSTLVDVSGPHPRVARAGVLDVSWILDR